MLVDEVTHPSPLRMRRPTVKGEDDGPHCAVPHPPPPDRPPFRHHPARACHRRHGVATHGARRRRHQLERSQQHGDRRTRQAPDAGGDTRAGVRACRDLRRRQRHRRTLHGLCRHPDVAVCRSVPRRRRGWQRLWCLAGLLSFAETVSRRRVRRRAGVDSGRRSQNQGSRRRARSRRRLPGPSRRGWPQRHRAVHAGQRTGRLAADAAGLRRPP